MKENNYLRIKIYIFILLFSACLGSAVGHKVPVLIKPTYTVYDKTFGFDFFYLCLAIGFGATLIYDISVYLKNKK